MEYVRMGNSGLKLSMITFGSALTIGTESQDINYAKDLIRAAWDLGIRSFDVSNNYGMGNAEIITGKVLEEYNRQDYVIATKGSWPIGDTPYYRGLSRKHILWAFEESLKRMNMDYIDIYYAHRYDSETCMEEVVRTYGQLINSGKIRYWATSEWPIEALKECHEVCERLNVEKPILEQFIYSYAITKAETNGVKNYCDENNVGTLGFSPLCQGYLTGKYKNGIPFDSRIAKSSIINYNKTNNFYLQNKMRIDKFLKVCDKYNINPTHVAIQWGIRKKIYPVLGASKPEQLYNTINGLDTMIPEELWKDLE